MDRRLSKDEYFMSIAIAVSARSTCQRRSVGCVLVDAQGRIMSTGYNGVPRGQVHCIDEPCLGVGLASGEGLDLCRAIHAETNALAHCKDTLLIHAVYTTTFPCIHCMKQLSNTSAKELHFIHNYPSGYMDVINMKLIQHMTEFLAKIEGLYYAQRQSERGHSMGKGSAMASSD